jgi:hypothetical protein
LEVVVVDTKLFAFARNVFLELNKLLRLITVRTIVSMMLLKLADISLPAEIGIINERNSCVSLIVGLMLGVGIESTLRLARHVDLCFDLEVVLLHRLSLDSILLGDDGKLDRF